MRQQRKFFRQGWLAVKVKRKEGATTPDLSRGKKGSKKSGGGDTILGEIISSL